MENTTDIYNSYHAMTAKIMEDQNRMAEICASLGMEQQREELIKSRDKLEKHKFSVGVLGEFRRGKSTVINAMLGREIMPSDILPTTATMNRVSYGNNSYAELKLIDGTTQKIKVEELSEYVTKVDEDCAQRAAKVEEAVVYYPCQFCQNGVDIIDTPGLNDDERMDKITENIIPKLDAVIMVTVPGSPFSQSEAEFVRNKLMCSDVGRLIFLVNKIDTVRKESDRIRIVEDIRKRVETSVLNRTKEIYGEDSEQYRNVEMKLADIRVYPISALDALEGRTGNDPELLKRSGMLEFESALSYMLTEERGAMEFIPPLSRLLSIGNEVMNRIALNQGSLETDMETFRDTQTKVKNEIIELKNQKEATAARLRSKAKVVRTELSAKAEDCYGDMEEAAFEIIEKMTPPEGQKKKMSDAQKQEVLQRTIKEIEEKMNDILSIHAERQAEELNAIIEEEGTDIAAKVLAKGQMQIDQQFEGISLKKKDDGDLANSTMAIALETATTYMGVVGVGGLLRGYRAAGIKGAAIGGVTGAAITYGAVVALAALTGPIGLPLVVLTSVGGTFGGGMIAEWLCGKDMLQKQMAELKQALQEKVKEAITQMRINKELEKWIQESVTEQFDSLIADMDAECMRIVNDAEQKISEIEKNLCMEESRQEQEKASMEKLQSKAESLIAELTKIYEILAGNLKQGA